MSTVIDAPDVDTHEEIDEGKLPPRQGGCHLLESYLSRGRGGFDMWAPAPFGKVAQPRSLCGQITTQGIPLSDPGTNCLGPRCDGPSGCGRERCPACVAVWMDRQMKA